MELGSPASIRVACARCLRDRGSRPRCGPSRRRVRQSPVRPALALLLPAFCALCAEAAPARAGEKEWILAPQPGFALIKTAPRLAGGGGGGIDASYGVPDAIAVRVTGAASAHSLPPLLDP